MSLEEHIQKYAEYYEVPLPEGAEAVEIAVRSQLALDPLPAEGAVMEMLVAHERDRAAYSFHIRNLARNSMGAAAAATGALTALGKAALDAPGASSIITGAGAAVALAVGLHLTRRVSVSYEDACLLHLAWSIAEQDGPPFVTGEEVLLKEIGEFPSRYRIHGYNRDKLKNSLNNLSSLGAVRESGEIYMLVDRISWR